MQTLWRLKGIAELKKHLLLSMLICGELLDAGLIYILFYARMNIYAREGADEVVFGMMKQQHL